MKATSPVQQTRVDTVKELLEASPVLMDNPELQQQLVEGLEQLSEADLDQLETLLKKESSDWESLLKDYDTQREQLLETCRKQAKELQNEAEAKILPLKDAMHKAEEDQAEALLDDFDRS